MKEVTLQKTMIKQLSNHIRFQKMVPLLYESYKKRGYSFSPISKQALTLNFFFISCSFFSLSFCSFFSSSNLFFSSFSLFFSFSLDVSLWIKIWLFQHLQAFMCQGSLFREVPTPNRRQYVEQRWRYKAKSCQNSWVCETVLKTCRRHSNEDAFQRPCYLYNP